MKPLVCCSLLICVLAVVVSGCAENPGDVASSVVAVELVNTTCPIMGHEIVAKDLAPDLIKDFNGKKVGFCCPPCLEEWDALTDAEKTEKLAKPSEAHAADHDHGSHDHAEPKADEPAAEK